MNFRSVQGMGRQLPLPVLGVVVAQFSLAGFPILAGFPVLLLLLNQLVQTSAVFAVITLLGSFGLLVGGLRSLAVLVMGPEKFDEEPISINPIAQIYLFMGISLLFLIGVFPNWFSTISMNLVAIGLGQ